MGAFQDLAGQRFGLWLVLSRDPERGRGSRWLCRCDCGVERLLPSNHLTAGRSKSCGCRLSMHAGLKHTPTWNSWSSMWARCTSRSHHAFGRYGGRGISICERWGDFRNFLADMGTRPPGTTLDRIDNDGNYEPGNCRWATQREQGNNRRSCTRIVFQGRAQTLRQWSSETGLGAGTIAYRIAAGWPVEAALTEPATVPRAGGDHA